jgi:hypothetical protein
MCWGRFTGYSQVYIDDKKADTTFIDSRTLLVPDEAVETGSVISVARSAKTTSS